MKKIILALIAACMSLTGTLAWGKVDAVTRLNVKVGIPFEIAVKDQSASTGYTTVLKKMPERLVLVSAEDKGVLLTTADGSQAPSKITGAPSTKVFTFIATEQLEGELEINAARMWEKPIKWLYNSKDKQANDYFYYIKTEKN